MRLLLVLSLLWFGLMSCGQAAEFHFDMGPDSGPVAAGYTQVTPAHLLAANPAFGWTARPYTTIYRNEPTNPYYYRGEETLEYALYSDGVLSLEENSFVFQVPPGRYGVTAIIGDLSLGEGRPGNGIWANGVQVANNETTDGTVKAFTFPVDAPEGRITLRFRADSQQKYATVIGVTAKTLAEGETVAASVKQYPEQLPTPEIYLRNWQRLQDNLLADWEKAKAELAAEGVDLAYGQRVAAQLARQPGARQHFGWGLGSGSWERLAQKTGSLDMTRLCVALKEMGADGFLTNSALVAAGLKQAGLQYAVSGHAEHYATNDLTGVTLNLLKSAAGQTLTRPGVWSNCAPEAIAAFRELWQKTLAPVAEGASFFLIDEPRGMWYSGDYGDHSAPAQAAFQRFAAEKGWADLAGRGIPERGRTLDFYRFYLFRLESVALFVKAATRETPAANMLIMPGNGNAGPEQMNHNSYWPPAMARQGLAAVTWAYDSPASCKMYAETVKVAQEWGGEVCITPPLYVEAHTPLQDMPMNTACISALTPRVAPWHFRGPLNGPDRVQWMKAFYYGARLTHLTTGLTATPALHVWCPDSLVFNDLVEMNRAEAGNWAKTWQCLFDANIDYGVTNKLTAPPANGVVLWSCVQPVLSDEEFGWLQGFLKGGGRLLCAFEGTPQRPDGTALPGWQSLPAKQIMRVALEPQALQAMTRQLNCPRNLDTPPAVKSHLYRRTQARVHLLNNTSLSDPVSVRVPGAMIDLLTGKPLATGTRVTLQPGHYALWQEL
jgi:hypothetical protein